MIGTTRARVSFFMNKFRKLGFIKYNGGIEVHTLAAERDPARSAADQQYPHAQRTRSITSLRLTPTCFPHSQSLTFCEFSSVHIPL